LCPSNNAPFGSVCNSYTDKRLLVRLRLEWCGWMAHVDKLPAVTCAGWISGRRWHDGLCASAGRPNSVIVPITRWKIVILEVLRSWMAPVSLPQRLDDHRVCRAFRVTSVHHCERDLGKRRLDTRVCYGHRVLTGFLTVGAEGMLRAFFTGGAPLAHVAMTNGRSPVAGP